MPIYTLDEVQILSEYEAEYKIDDESLQELYDGFGEEITLQLIQERLYYNFQNAVATCALETRQEDMQVIGYNHFKEEKTVFKMTWRPTTHSCMLIGGYADGEIVTVQNLGDLYHAVEVDDVYAAYIESLVSEVEPILHAYKMTGWTNAGHWIYSVVS